jgi:FkbM family methyltransferase
MQAILFDDFKVKIDERAAKSGYCWHGQYRDGIPLNVDEDLEKFFYERTLEYEQPVVLDIGASNGVFSMIAAINPGMRVYAFEPTPSTYEILKRNIFLNNLNDRVKTFQFALADKKGTAVLKYPKSGENDGLACIGNPLRFKEWVEFEVPVSTVDDFVREQGIEKVDLIKVDTEGCELLVLKGAEELIKKCHPNILCEYWEPNTKQFGYHPSEILKLLIPWGYQCTIASRTDMYFCVPKQVHAVKTTLGTKNTETGAQSKSGVSNVRDCSDMTSRKLPAGVEESGVSKGSHLADEMQEWIERLASFQNRLYYRDQTPQSLNALVELVHRYNPTKIVELGTLSGLSLRAWLSAKSDAEIIAIDLSFVALYQSQQYLPANLSRVNLLEQDILKTDFAQLWSDEDRVILYVDAHDTPNNPIMAYILKNALPALPEDSVVAVDDLWYCNQAISDDTVAEFFKEVATNEVDSLGYFDGYYAPYWKGGFFVGFPEVIPLMVWVNRNNINLSFEPGNKLIMFEHRQAQRSTANPDFNLEAFNKLTGNLHYNPVDQITVYEEKNILVSQQAVALCQKGKSFFVAGCVSEASDCFNRAVALTPNISGAFYAKAICLAILGQFDSAVKVLQSEIDSKLAHPNAQILYEDIKRYLAKKLKRVVKHEQEKQPKGLSIFAIPKPFTDAFALIQENAIKSWMSLKPRPEIILFGDDDGVAEFAQKHNLKHICDVQRNEFGTPLVNDLFLKAQRTAASEICAYVNTDIILMDDFAEAIEKVAGKFEQFLMIGRRWDFDISEEIKFDVEGWQQQLRQQVVKDGFYHEPTGIDYFVFRKGLWGDIPPFAIGRNAWDNWLVDTAVNSQYPVVDASQDVMVIHQNHDFSHIPGGKEAASFKVEEQRNRRLAPHTNYTGFTTQAIWKLAQGDIGLKSVGEFLQNEDLLMVLQCIDRAYQHAPEVVKKQYDEFIAQAKPEDLTKLSIAARTELLSGSAKDAARLVLHSTNADNQVLAAELFRKGFVCLRDGNAADAVKYLDKAAVNFAGLPDLYFAIATAYAQLGDLYSARKACRMEMSLHPENDGAKRLLQRIEKEFNESVSIH